MAEKSTFVDYDPLTRKRSAGSADSDDVEMGVSRGSSRFNSETWLEREPKRLENEAAAVARPQPLNRSERWIFKQGHTLSYIGLFLFTFLVYCRPYELFPALSWLSNTPFWVAVVTIAVFIPTQLGLENRITIKPLEVKLLALLVLASLVSMVFALDRLRAWNTFVDYLKIVLMFIVIINVVRTEKRLKAIWILILFVTCILSLAAINDYRLGRLALRGVRIKGIIGGLFENPNDLALHLVTMTP